MTNLKVLLSQIDIRFVLNALGIRYLPGLRGYNNEQICGFCPDHHLFTGRYPSHPKWYLNIKTGETYCFTEGRGSNIVAIIMRLLNCDEIKAYRFLENASITTPSIIKYKIDKKEKIQIYASSFDNTSPKENKMLKSLLPFFEKGFLSDEAINFFKKDNIDLSILKEYCVISMNRGKYVDRVIIPFRDLKGNIISFIAVDILGKRKWIRKKINNFKKYNKINSFTKLRQLYEKYDNLYRKALYCPNVRTGNHLFGLWYLLKHNKNIKNLILVEGERDVLKLQQEGFNAVGTHGAHLTDGQLEILLELGVKKVWLAYDGDKAGRNASEKILEKLVQFNIKVFDLILPVNKDPKKFSRNEFIELIQNQTKKGGKNVNKTNNLEGWQVNPLRLKNFKKKKLILNLNF